MNTRPGPRALACVLLGALSTVALSWVLARPARLGPSPAMAIWSPRPGSDSTINWTTESDQRLTGARWFHESAFRDGADRNRFTLAAGWPLPALQSHAIDPDPAATQWEFLSLSEGVTLPTTHDWRGYTLPVRPIWPGFAINSALYAAAWYLLLFTTLLLYRAGRRRFRVSRNMCPACAYDLRGSPTGPCPECGHSPAKPSS